MITKIIPIKKNNLEILEDLEDIQTEEIYNPFYNIELVNNFITTSKVSNILSRNYLSKNICVEYVENISEPSFRVPNDSVFRFVVKIDNKLVFVKENPKKLVVYIKEELDELIGTPFRNNSTYTIAKKLYTNDNNYSIFSFPFGGIQKTDSFFYYVSSDMLIKKLEEDVDYINGTLKLNSKYDDVLFVFGCFNLVPLKIIEKGLIEIKETESSFYNIENIDENNFIKLNYLDNNTMTMTTAKDIMVERVEGSLPLSVDGIPIKEKQTFFMNKNETIIIEKNNSESEKNLEYLSLNTSLKNNMEDSLKDDVISVVSDKEMIEKTYKLQIINRDFLNIFMNRTPITLELF